MEGAASPMTATVLLLLMAAGVFSAMMKAAGLAEALAAFTGGAIAGTPLLTPAVFLISSLLAHSHRQLHFYDSGCIPHLFGLSALRSAAMCR